MLYLLLQYGDPTQSVRRDQTQIREVGAFAAGPAADRRPAAKGGKAGWLSYLRAAEPPSAGAYRPPDSVTRPSATSFRRCASSERAAMECSLAGASA
jgi:hypothetical protein